MPEIKTSDGLGNHYSEISELYHLLNEGMEAEKNNRVRPFRDAVADMKRRNWATILKEENL